MRWFLTLLLAAVVGCDAAPDLPEATNPYDPRYGDGRLPSPVGEIRLESATASSVTFAWDDPSSFETRFILQTAGDYGTPPPPSAFRFASYLDANTTSFSWVLAPSVGYISYRLITQELDGESSPASPSIRIHQPGTYALSNLSFGSRNAYPSIDGEWVYTNGGSSVGVWDPRTGGSRGLHANVDAYVGTLASGDDVLLAAQASLRSTPLVALLMVVDGSQVQRTVQLQGFPAFTPEAATTNGIRASADGSRIVARDGDDLGAWSMASGDRVGTVSGLSGHLRSVSADGRLVLVSTNDGLALADLDTGQVRWRTLRYKSGLLSSDASLLLGSRYTDRGVETVDLQTGEPTGVLEASGGRPLEPIVFDVTGEFVGVSVRAINGRHYIDVYRVSDLSVVRKTSVLSPSDPSSASAVRSVRILDGADRIGRYSFRSASEGYIEVLDYVTAWQVVP